MKQRKHRGMGLALGLVVALLLTSLPLSAGAEPYYEDETPPASSETAPEETPSEPESEESEAEPGEDSSFDETDSSLPQAEEEESEESASSSESPDASISSAPAVSGAGSSTAQSSSSGARMMPATDMVPFAMGDYDADHLQQLVDDADPGDTIVLDGSFMLDKTVTINKPLTLSGANGANVSLTWAGAADGRHLAIDSGAGLVALQFVDITGGNSGGGITHTGSGGLSILAGTLSGNTNSGRGGAIYSGSDGDIILISCTVSGNTAAEGGGVYGEALVYPQQQTLFEGNSATAGSGGGVYSASIITDVSSFTGNTASGHGGGIFVANASAGYNTDVSRLYGGTISGNTAGGNGGGAAFDAIGKHRLQYVTIEDNSATNGGGLWMSDSYSGSIYVSSGTIVQRNTASNRGGGVYGATGTYFEGGCEVLNNSAAYGGGMASTWNGNLANCTFAGNYASKAGGGVYMVDPEGMLALQYAIMKDNTTSGVTGGAIYLTEFTYIYTLYSTFSGNRSARGVYWDLANPVTPEQEMATERYPNDILHTEHSEPFTNVYNDWDISFFFDAEAMYAVRFEPNGGEWQDDGGEDDEPNPTEYLISYFYEGDKVTLPARLVKDDETPAGWYTDEALRNAWDFENGTVQGNMTLYAKWALHEYDVTFVPDTEDSSANFELNDIPEGSLVEEPDEPDKPGYDFDGWYTEPEYIHKWDFDKDKLTGDTTLYARWRDDGLIDVTFVSDGKTYLKYTDEDAGVPFARPTDPDKPGYILVGWYEDLSDPATAWDFDSQSTKDDITLYALWRDDDLVDITYMSDGSVYRKVDNYPRGILVKEPTAPDKPGYLLLGWYTEDGGMGTKWDFASGRPDDDLTLYAHWRALEMYTVTYKDGDDILYPPEQAQELSLLTAPDPDPEKDGYLFAGWYKDKDLTTRWDFAYDRVTEDTTLYARWRDDGLVDAIFVVDGTVYDSLDDLPAGSRLEEPDVPQKNGYVFVGWEENADATPADGDFWDFGEDVAQDDVTLYAIFRVQQRYNVFYHISGGIWSSSYGVAEGSLLEPPTEPTTLGKLFGGWYRDEELTVRWDFAHDTLEGNLDLYGRWRNADDSLIDIVFIADGRTEYYYDDIEPNELIDKPKDPEKEGYEFLGWAETDGGELWDFSGDKPAADTTLYAQWRELEKYTVDYFTDDNGTPYHTEQVYEHSKLTPPENPPQNPDGEYFEGWYKDSGRTIPWDFAVDTVEDDTQLYARFVEGFDVYYVADGKLHHHETGIFEGAILLPPQNPTRGKATFNGWYKGTMDDLPAGTLPASGLLPASAGLQPLAAPAAAIILYWVFENDAMPAETLVLVADFTDPPATPAPTAETPDPAASVTGDGASSGGTDSSSSSTSASSGTSSSSRVRSTATGTTARRGGGSSVARTGDSASLTLFGALAALALAATGLLLLRKRKHK